MYFEDKQIQIQSFNKQAIQSHLKYTQQIAIYSTVVALAKREYRKGREEATKSSSAAIQLMRLAALRQEKSPPPLGHEGRLMLDYAERAEILRDSFLARHQVSNDLLTYGLSGCANILWTKELTKAEFISCTIRNGNTYPGAYGILVELLQPGGLAQDLSSLRYSVHFF